MAASKWLIKHCESQILCCFCLVTAQLPGEDGYSGGKVIFIDTENTLYPHNGNNHTPCDLQFG